MPRAFLILVVLLAGAVIWWATKDSRSSSLDGPVSSSRAEDSPEEREPTLAASPMAAASTPEETPTPGASAATEPFRLRGRVVEVGSGMGVAGAWVHVSTHRSDLRRRIASGADGVFELTWGEASAEVYVLGGGWVTERLAEVRADGFNPIAVKLIPDAVTKRVLPVVRAGVVRGRVLDETGVPVAGAGVYVLAKKKRRSGAFPQVPTALSRATAVRTDAAGRYRLEALIPGLQHVAGAFSESHAACEGVSFLAQSGVVQDLDIHLSRSRWMRARVVQAGTDKGVENVEVRASTRGPYAEHLERVAKTDADGWARLGPLARGLTGAGISSQEWRMVAAPPVLWDPAAEDDVEFVIEVVRALRIAGTLLDMRGQPAIGAWVEARQGDREFCADTDEAGAFKFTHLAEGTWTLNVLEHYRGSEVLLTQRVEAGDEAVKLRLTKPLAFDTEVVITGPNGEPVARCDFQVRVRDTSRIGTNEQTPILLMPSKQQVWLEASAPRAADGSPLPFAAESMGPFLPGAHSLTLRLGTGAEIRGRIVAGAGKGVLGVGLSAFPLDRGVATGVMNGMHSTVRSDEDGVFRLWGLRQQTDYYLFVDAGDRWAPVTRLEVRSGAQDVVVALELAVDVELRIVDADGKPVERVQVQVSRLGTRHGLVFGRTDDAGRLLVRGLSRSGRYVLELRPPKGRQDLRVLELASWSLGEPEVSLQRADVVRGTVVDEAGQPVGRASVIAEDAAGTEHVVTSDSSGRFVLGQLAPGALRVVAQTREQPTRRSHLVETQSSAQSLALVVRQLGRMTVTLENWAPALSKVGLLLRPRSRQLGPPPYGQAGENGQGEIANVDPEETYDLHVVVETRKGTLVGWAQALKGSVEAIQLPLKPEKKISGRLISPAGLRPGSVRIRERGIDLRATVDAQGRFTFVGLPEGTFELLGVSHGVEQRHEVRKRVSAGSEVELR